MKNLICMMTLFSSLPPLLLFDFTKKANIQDWRVVDDVVMGGVSSGSFSLNSDGFAVFEGAISLENNGGFSSVRYRFPKVKTEGYSSIVNKLRADAKNYQFRIKTNSTDSHSFIAPFSTSGEWQEITIQLKDMYPAFRGRTLEQPNFSDPYFEEIAFLIGNKKQEQFKLIIDRIELR